MSFKLTEPETQDVEALETLFSIVGAFADAARFVKACAKDDSPGVIREPQEGKIRPGAQEFLDALHAASGDDAENLARLRLVVFSLKLTFEDVAAVAGTQEKVLAYVPLGLLSAENAALIEKYELKDLAMLVEKAKGPDPS